MTLTIRFEKLKFLVEEMQLAFGLVKHAPSDDHARMLARHILVRARDFIAHARQLGNVLKGAGYNVTDFHRAKEIYATDFDQYFAAGRDKLGAHVQDFDFGKRIELWNDVETIKVDYFVDGAREVYGRLAPLGVPEYQPVSTPVELSDPKVIQELEAYRNSLADVSGIEMATDPLAMTRARTTAMLNATPVHNRAGQLNLIKRWVRTQRTLLPMLAASPGLVRLLKARIVTDIVSFCDCLVTRPVAPGAPQQMAGLDELLPAAGASSAAIANFVRVYKFNTRLAIARECRDKIGAHLEIGDAIPLADLLNLLDTFDLDAALTLFDRADAAFRKTCWNVFFLRTHLADGQRVRGVLAGASPVVPFDTRAEVSAVMPTAPPKFDDDPTYANKLALWEAGDQEERGDARHYFFLAFMHASTVDSFDTEESLGGGSTRHHRHEWRTSHAFMLRRLIEGSDREVVDHLLPLIVECANGDPDVLTEVLLRFPCESDRPALLPAVCYALGRLARWWNLPAQEVLRDDIASSSDWRRSLLARIALFHIYIRTEGLARANRQPRVGDYDGAVGWLAAEMSSVDELEMLIVLASQFSDRSLAIFATYFVDERQKMAERIEQLSRTEIFGDAFDSQAGKLRALVVGDDYVGLCLLLVEHLAELERVQLAEELLTFCCRGVVVQANHDQALRHLVGCFCRLGEMDDALVRAEDLARRHPDDLNHQIMLAKIFSAAMPEERARAADFATELRSNYNLTREIKMEVAAIEASLTPGPNH